jgi:hypothetical protein
MHTGRVKVRKQMETEERNVWSKRRRVDIHQDGQRHPQGGQTRHVTAATNNIENEGHGQIMNAPKTL